MAQKRSSTFFGILILVFCLGITWILPAVRLDAATVKDGQEQMELFEGYLEKISSGQDTRKNLRKSAGDKLTGINKTIYDILKQDISAVAAGNQASTVFEISADELNLEKNSWTAADLGVESIIVDGSISKDAANAMMEKLGYDLNKINGSLLADHPYDLYWYDKTEGVSNGYQFGVKSQYDPDLHGYEYCIFLDSISFSFSVADGYSDGAYTVNTEIGKSTRTIVENASAIVEKYKDKTDIEKLNGYREEICRLVAYNDEAASGGISYGNPWQLIWVFDEDVTTNVVCEGYAKAFHFLCKLSTFNGNIDCISVTGNMAGGTGQGPHMWNIVNMDGNNYLVDVTNCDTGTVGADDQLFLVGYTDGDWENGYRFNCKNSSITYVYDDETLGLYNPEELIIVAKGTHIHSYTITSIEAATCTKTGSKVLTCSCGDSYTEEIPMVDHSFTEYTSNNDAACEKDGTKTAFCDYGCGNSDTQTDEGTALGHSYTQYISDDNATCTEDGTKTAVCDHGCGKKNTVKDEGSIRDHSFTEYTSNNDATCEKDGTKTAACDYGCGATDTIQDEGSAGHIWKGEYTIDKAATCSEAGSESIHCSVCGMKKVGSDRTTAKKNHIYGEWKTIKQASTTSTGLKERSCKNCGAKEQQQIPKIVPPAPSVPTVIPAEISPSSPVAISSVDRQIITARSDADQRGSVFSTLQAKGTAKSNTSVKISWKRVSGASTYIVYGNKCGAGNSFVRLATVTGTSFTQKKLIKGTYYKYIVVAVNGQKVLTESKTVHVATKGGKVGNNKSITTKAKKNKVSLKKGKAFKLGAKATAQSKKLKVKKHRGIAYESNNKSIATVSGKGVIKAVGKGTCTVFAYTQDGVCKKIKVTVK